MLSGGKTYPGRSAAERLLFPRRGKEEFFLLPVFREVKNAGSPREAYGKLAREDESFGFLLESASSATGSLLNFRSGRYSFLGGEPFLIFTSKGERIEISGRGWRGKTDFSGYRRRFTGNPIQALRALLGKFASVRTPGMPPFTGGAVGYFGYDVRHFFERLPRRSGDDLGLPDIRFVFTDTVVAYDHRRGSCWICANVFLDGNTDIGCARREAEERIERLAERLERSAPARSRPPVGGKKVKIEANLTRTEFEEMVRRAKEYIRAGDIYQANLSQRFSGPLRREPFELYRILQRINPSNFAAYLDLGDLQIVSGSPERLVRLEGDLVETRPIAGTRPRGKNRDQDRELSRELILNEKERAEHIMLVDLERNDLGRVCRYGTVRVDELMTLEKYSHVIHIVSNVRGRLAEGKDRFDLLAAVFPGGTITGAPKIRCMEIIDELEPIGRNVYTGSLGYLAFNGDMDLNIVIRTFVVTGGRAYVQAGAGIVADSDPGREYEETLYKAEALLAALAE